MKSIKKTQTAWSGRKRATLIGVCVAGVMLPLDVTVVGVALDSIGRDLEASFAGLQWVVNAYNLVFGSLLLTAGTLADLFGRRRMFALGIMVFTLSSLLCGFSQSPLMLNLLRAFQGIGAAFVLTSGTAAIANEFRTSVERAKAFGILGSSFGIGLALGPLVGGVFSSGLGWRWIFFVNVPVGISVLAMAVPRMSESSDPGATRVDWAGLITFTLSLFLFIYALIGGPEEGWGSPRIVGTLLGAVVSVTLFVVAEQLQRRPMFDLNLFRKPTFVAAMVLPVAVAFGFVALLVYIPLYFQSVNGYSPIQAGLIVMPLTVPVLFVPTLVGRLTEHISARVLLTSGLMLIGLGALLMSGLEVGGGWTTLVSGLIVTGVGTGVCNGLMDNLAISVAPIERSGMAAGIFNTMRLAGDAIAIALSGAILIGLTKSRLLDLIWGTPAATEIQTTELINSVARGDIQRAAASVPIAGRALFLQAATQSYTNALNTVFIILACTSFASAVLTLVLVRKRDIVEEPVPLNQP